MDRDYTREEILAQLRRVVEAAPEDRLHMRRYAEEAECGTALCAAGFCLIDPWFRARTLILGYFDDASELELHDLFQIDEEDARNLFGFALYRGVDPHAVTKAEVLWNVDELLAGRPARPYAAAKQHPYTDDVVHGPYAADREPWTLPSTVDPASSRAIQNDKFFSDDWVAEVVASLSTA